MTVMISLRLPDEEAARLDELVAAGRYPDRSAALRAAVAGLLRAEREQAIANAYQRGYGAQPSDTGWAEDAAASLDRVLTDRGE